MTIGGTEGRTRQRDWTSQWGGPTPVFTMEWRNPEADGFRIWECRACSFLILGNICEKFPGPWLKGHRTDSGRSRLYKNRKVRGHYAAVVSGKEGRWEDTILSKPLWPAGWFGILAGVLYFASDDLFWTEREIMQWLHPWDGPCRPGDRRWRPNSCPPK